MTLHKGNYYKWRQSRQRYAVKAVLGRIAHIREVLLLTVDLRGFQGNGSKYGRLQGNVEHGCLEVEAGPWCTCRHSLSMNAVLFEGNGPLCPFLQMGLQWYLDVQKTAPSALYVSTVEDLVIMVDCCCKEPSKQPRTRKLESSNLEPRS